MKRIVYVQNNIRDKYITYKNYVYKLRVLIIQPTIEQLPLRTSETRVKSPDSKV